MDNSVSGMAYLRNKSDTLGPNQLGNTQPERTKLPVRRFCKCCGRKRYINSFLHDDGTYSSIICKDCLVDYCETPAETFIRRSQLRFRTLKNNRTERQQIFIDHFSSMVINAGKFMRMDRYFTADECNEIKVYGEDISRYQYEPINFEGNDSKRSQKTIFMYTVRGRKRYRASEPPRCIMEFIDFFQDLHPDTIQMTWKLLKSDTLCDDQTIHADDSQMASCPGNKKFSSASFSMLVALEPDENRTELIIAQSSNCKATSRLRLTQGSVVLFRGDLPHAGSSYPQPNVRAFVAIGTSTYKHNGREVGLYK